MKFYSAVNSIDRAIYTKIEAFNIFFIDYKTICRVRQLVLKCLSLM